MIAISLVIVLTFLTGIIGKSVFLPPLSGNDNSNIMFENLRLLLQEIMIRNLQPFRCVTIINDDLYGDLFEIEWFQRFDIYVSFLKVNIADIEDTLIPYNSTATALLLAKDNGCQIYIILISNTYQVVRLLHFGNRYRIIDSRAQFVFLYDTRLFEKEYFYLWKRIINVVFIKSYIGKRKENSKDSIPWYELLTVPFPSPLGSVLVPRRLDIWTKNGFRRGSDLFRDKTSDLKNQSLKVVTFPHIPAVTKIDVTHQINNTALSFGDNKSTSFTGVEIEILQTVSSVMNFRYDIYEVENAETELWGRKLAGKKYTGLIGEVTTDRADIALGDLYYTPYFLELMDLTIPYNTECLTFITPAALTDNSWKTLILPFKPIMWSTVIACLFVSGLVFYLLAHFQCFVSGGDTSKTVSENKSVFYEKKQKFKLLSLNQMQKDNLDVKYSMLREMYKVPKDKDQPVGLYQFAEPGNSLLYTYSMLLLVSLPKLPTGWSLRMFTGWYWLYCLLVVVAYRASMTAILARPIQRVTIDTLQELVDSKLLCGSWSEINQKFFESSLDQASKTIAKSFEIVNDTKTAIDKVAEGNFAFYENAYYLKEASVKRQVRSQMLTSSNGTSSNETQETRDNSKQDRILHIMNDCIIKMPISIGLQRNSPIKPRVDRYIRRVVEAGLVTKWLDDVIQAALNAEIAAPEQSREALMDMAKLFGALVALFIGYFISLLSLVIEILHFRYAEVLKAKIKHYRK